MKYWFFDGNDVVGPFEPNELLARPGFAATSLVCPEKFSEDQDSWKLAGSFEDFHFHSKEEPLPPPPDSTDSFDEEMDTLLKQRNPLGVPPDETATEGPSLEIPKKPAKPGPIEDYFNNIKGEDLGNILGIPDPNENSDMDLARALKTQLGKTNPPTDKEIHSLENDPFNEFTTDESAKEELPEEFLNPPAETPAPEPPAQEVPAPPQAPVQTDLASEQAVAQPPAAQPEKDHGPASVPISQPAETENDFVLTLHGQPPATPAEQPAQPAERAEKLPEEKTPESTCQLPVLDQPVTEIPSLSQAEAALPAEIPAPEPPQPGQTAETAEPVEAELQPAQEISQQTQEELPPQTQELTPAPQPALEKSPAVSAEEEPASSLEQAPLSAESPKAPALQEEQPEELVPENDPKEETVRQILEEGKLEVIPTPEIKEPIKDITVEPEVNQVRPRLKQTPEIKDFLRQTQNERLEREQSHKKAMAALSVLVALLAVGGAVYLNQTVLQRPSEPAPAKNYEQESILEEPAPAVSAPDEGNIQAEIPVPPPAQLAAPSQSDQAVEIVKNYPLSANRGTVASYLDRLYRTQKTQGYTASWSAEPLHKSTYIVKYRLTKTRMEPIVYIFQVDVAQGKLTGALNNITLDLVGKIQ